MTIEESNKIIAEFMFGRPSNKGKGDHWLIDRSIPAWFAEIYEEKYLTADSLFYHTSWDWLMPVVEKIEGNAAYVSIHKNCIEIDHIAVKKGENTKIEASYQAVIQFIQFYNTNPKQ